MDEIHHVCIPVNTKHFYDMCTMLDVKAVEQTLYRWTKNILCLLGLATDIHYNTF